MLEQIANRYQRPIVIRKPQYGEYREPWWRRFLPEVEHCLGKSYQLFGVCRLTPRWTIRMKATSLRRTPASGTSLEKNLRVPHEPSLTAIREFQARMARRK